jgi:LemA protein
MRATGRRCANQRMHLQCQSQTGGAPDMTGWIIAAVAAAVVIYVIVIFNSLVRQRNLVREGWSGIDVQLKRRTDLVPNLVETVKAYAAHERTVLDEVTQSRATSIAADNVAGQASAERALQGALGRLFAVAEAYPQLKADKNFLELQQQLAEIEDQLQMARRYYNGTARNLNIGIQSFPANLMAGLLGFREQPFFELEDRAQAAAPSVAFQSQKP